MTPAAGGFQWAGAPEGSWAGMARGFDYGGSVGRQLSAVRGRLSWGNKVVWPRCSPRHEACSPPAAWGLWVLLHERNGHHSIPLPPTRTVCEPRGSPAPSSPGTSGGGRLRAAVSEGALAWLPPTQRASPVLPSPFHTPCRTSSGTALLLPVRPRALALQGPWGLTWKQGLWEPVGPPWSRLCSQQHRLLAMGRDVTCPSCRVHQEGFSSHRPRPEPPLPSSWPRVGTHAVGDAARSGHYCQLRTR